MEPSKKFILKFHELKSAGIISSDSDFCRLISWNTSSLSQALSGKRAVPKWVIYKFAEIFKIPLEEFGLQAPPINNNTPGAPIQGVNLAPLITRSSLVNYHSRYEDEQWIQAQPKWAVMGDYGADIRCFEIGDDSMEPTLCPGDYLLCVRADPFAIKQNYIYVSVLKNTTICRRIDATDHSVFLKADNETYSMSTVNKEDILEIWIGVARCSFDLSTPSTAQKLRDLESRMELILDALKSIQKDG